MSANDMESMPDGKQASANGRESRDSKKTFGETAYTCQDCGKHFARSRYLKRHKRRVHERAPESHSQGRKAKLKLIGDDKNCVRSSLVCQHCGKRFTKPCTLKQHTLVHTGEMPLACEFCEKRFNHRSTLREHLIEHTENWPHTCQQCGQVFKRRCMLRIHTEKVHNETTVQAICSKRTEHAQKRKARLKLGDAEGCTRSPLVCQHCGKRFATRRILKVHTLVHTGEKPFVCEFCEMRFSHPSSLRDHLMEHTGNWPHSCQQCGQCFRRRNVLKIHMEKVHGDATRPANRDKPTIIYRCQACGKFLSSSLNLERHAATHIKHAVLKPFQCQICDKRFKRRRYLRRHGGVTHGNELPYTCQYCRSRFRTAEYLIAHHDRLHTEFGILGNGLEIAFTVGSQTRGDKPCDDSIAVVDSEKQHECQKFGKYVSSVTNYDSLQPTNECAADLSETTMISAAQRSIDCSVDMEFEQHGLAFNSSDIKLSSREMHHTCCRCDKSFTYASELKAHARKHVRRILKTHRCRLCGKNFCSSPNLIIHVTSHRSRKCGVCGRVFQSVFLSDEHTTKRHIEAKPHKCYYCDKGFSWLWNLKKHIRMHDRLYNFSTGSNKLRNPKIIKCADNSDAGRKEESMSGVDIEGVPVVDGCYVRVACNFCGVELCQKADRIHAACTVAKQHQCHGCGEKNLHSALS